MIFVYLLLHQLQHNFLFLSPLPIAVNFDYYSILFPSHLNIQQQFL